MEPIDPSRLVYYDFDLKNITVMRSRFPNGTVTHYSKGRQKHLLHFVLSGSREYLCNGRRFTVPTGTILLITDGTAYTSRPMDNCSGIGICFNTDIQLSKGIYYEWADSSGASKFFEQLEQIILCEPAALMKLKITLFRLLHSLVSVPPKDVAVIRPAVEYIGSHFVENLPVSLYAKCCNMSESYFRRRFRECMGCSPIEYRNELRFKEAERLYLQGQTLQLIAEQLGFYDAGCLCKQYKKHTGHSLKRTTEMV